MVSVYPKSWKYSGTRSAVIGGRMIVMCAAASRTGSSVWLGLVSSGVVACLPCPHVNEIWLFYSNKRLV